MGFDVPPIEHTSTLVYAATLTLLARDTSLETRPTDQPMIIRSNVASTSTSPSSRWHNTFMPGDKPLPNDSYVRTWRSGLEGQVVESLS